MTETNDERVKRLELALKEALAKKECDASELNPIERVVVGLDKGDWEMIELPGGVSINVRKTVDRELELKVQKLHELEKRVEAEEEIDEYELVSILSDILARMCKPDEYDGAFSNSETYMAIHEVKGKFGLMQLAEAIMQPFSDNAERMGKFRAERKRK